MIDYEAFFRVMKIRNEQIKKRIRTAEEIEDEFLYWLSYLEGVKSESGYESALQDFSNALEEYVNKTIDAPIFATEYADKVSESVYAYTWSRLQAEQGEEEHYVTSLDRAMLLAAGAALSIWGYKEYVDAYSDGYTEKTWICTMDGRERESHAEMNGTTVGIDEYFVFEDCQMLYPGDILNGSMYQISNCRCWLECSGKGKSYDYHNSAEDLKIDVENDKIKTASEIEFEKYHDAWPIVSLSETIERYNASYNRETKRKDIYRSADGLYDIVVDKEANYFRVKDASLSGRRQYTDIDGNNVANILENGTYRGRTTDEYESITHFVDKDKL